MSDETEPPFVTVFAQLRSGEIHEFGTVDAHAGDTADDVMEALAALLRECADHIPTVVVDPELGPDAARWSPVSEQTATRADLTMTSTAATATMSPVDVARHAAAYRLHAHADDDRERSRGHYDQYTSRGLTAAFAALANGGHRPLAAALQDEAYARKALRKLLDQPDDGSDVVRDAAARYERCRERVQNGLDELR